MENTPAPHIDIGDFEDPKKAAPVQHGHDVFKINWEFGAGLCRHLCGCG